MKLGAGLENEPGPVCAPNLVKRVQPRFGGAFIRIDLVMRRPELGIAWPVDEYFRPKDAPNGIDRTVRAG